MATNEAGPGGGSIPSWVKVAVTAIVGAVGYAAAKKLLDSYVTEAETLPPVPAKEPVLLLEPPSATVLREFSDQLAVPIVEKLAIHDGFTDAIRQQMAQALREARMEYERERHNYHYIRYGMLFAYILLLGQVPGYIKDGLDGWTLRTFGVALTVLAVIIDWRNYYLYRKEEGQAAWPPGPVTIAIALFYLATLVWFVLTTTIPVITHA